MSVFADSRNRRFPLTFLLLELIRDATEGVEVVNEASVLLHAAILVRILKEEKIVAKPTDDDVEYVFARLQAKLESNAAAKPGPKRSGKRGFGEYYVEWLNEMHPEELCFYLADYDFNRAKQIYCTLDYDDVYKLAEYKIKHIFEHNRILLEATAFGFGGGYDDGGSSDKNVSTGAFDMTTGSSEGMAELAKIF